MEVAPRAFNRILLLVDDVGVARSIAAWIYGHFDATVTFDNLATESEANVRSIVREIEMSILREWNKFNHINNHLPHSSPLYHTLQPRYQWPYPLEEHRYSPNEVMEDELFAQRMLQIYYCGVAGALERIIQSYIQQPCERGIDVSVGEDNMVSWLEIHDYFSILFGEVDSVYPLCLNGCTKHCHIPKVHVKFRNHNIARKVLTNRFPQHMIGTVPLIVSLIEGVSIQKICTRQTS